MRVMYFLGLPAVNIDAAWSPILGSLFLESNPREKCLYSAVKEGRFLKTSQPRGIFALRNSRQLGKIWRINYAGASGENYILQNYKKYVQMQMKVIILMNIFAN